MSGSIYVHSRLIDQTVEQFFELIYEPFLQAVAKVRVVSSGISNVALGAARYAKGQGHQWRLSRARTSDQGDTSVGCARNSASRRRNNSLVSGVISTCSGTWAMLSQISVTRRIRSATLISRVSEAQIFMGRKVPQLKLAGAMRRTTGKGGPQQRRVGLLRGRATLSLTSQSDPRQPQEIAETSPMRLGS